MTTRIGQSPQFPSNWAELYSLGYAEIGVILEALIDGDLTASEAHTRYCHHVQEHAKRSTLIAAEAARHVIRAKNAARQE